MPPAHSLLPSCQVVSCIEVSGHLPALAEFPLKQASCCYSQYEIMVGVEIFPENKDVEYRSNRMDDSGD